MDARLDALLPAWLRPLGSELLSTALAAREQLLAPHAARRDQLLQAQRQRRALERCAATLQEQQRALEGAIAQQARLRNQTKARRCWLRIKECLWLARLHRLKHRAQAQEADRFTMPARWLAAAPSSLQAAPKEPAAVVEASEAARLVAQLRELQAQADALEAAVAQVEARLAFGKDLRGTDAAYATAGRAAAQARSTTAQFHRLFEQQRFAEAATVALGCAELRRPATWARFDNPAWDPQGAWRTLCDALLRSGPSEEEQCLALQAALRRQRADLVLFWASSGLLAALPPVLRLVWEAYMQAKAQAEPWSQTSQPRCAEFAQQLSSAALHVLSLDSALAPSAQALWLWLFDPAPEDGEHMRSAFPRHSSSSDVASLLACISASDTVARVPLAASLLAILLEAMASALVQTALCEALAAARSI
jgi:hypothetical protein